MIDKGLDQVAQAATYGGATAAAVFWGLSVSDIGVIVSATVAVVGLTFHIYLSVKREHREVARHRLAMEALRSGTQTTFTERSASDA